MILFRGFFRWLIAERPASGKSFADHIAQLERGRDAVVQRHAQAASSDQNHDLMTHAIGIERWSQARLRVALGDALPDDEYDAYRPPRDTAWDDLKALFETTRAETLAIVQQLPPDALSQKVTHNSFGAMTIGGWLQYIYAHANLETNRMK